ncbi:MAG TPA: hypothetical protein VHB50_06585 [Bryobacteraceae bacterium]|nr:hypothetical protein [Bryobacteraceae bacterium]
MNVSRAYLYTATPYNLFISNAGVPALSVASVGGVAVKNPPFGNFVVPDVVINSSAPVSFSIQASNVPLGTTCTLTIFSENGPDLNITSSPLTGTVASSTATATATLPSGYSKGFVTANWTQ